MMHYRVKYTQDSQHSKCLRSMPLILQNLPVLQTTTFLVGYGGNLPLYVYEKIETANKK